jgi:hypothetical protein
MEKIDKIIDDILKVKLDLEEIDQDKFYETIYHLQLGLTKLYSIKKKYVEAC